jgi:hypothetical protein
MRDLLTNARDVAQRFSVPKFFIIMIKLAIMAKLPIKIELTLRAEVAKI